MLPTRPLLFAAAVLLAPACAFAQPLTLEDAIARALERDERLGMAAGDVAAARARLAGARSVLVPEVDVTATRLRRGLAASRTIGGVSVATRDTTFGAVDLQVPLWDARAWPLLRQARLGVEEAELDLTDERRRLVRDTADAFLVALSAEQVVEAASRRLGLARTGLDDVRARVEAGLVSSNDATKVELEEATAARDLTRAELAAEQARLDLALLVDAPVEPPLVEPAWLLDAADEPPPALVSLLARADATRTDVEARRRFAESLRAFAREATLRGWPRFDLTAGIDLREADGIGGAEDWSVGVDLTWDVFDGGLRAAQRRERLAQADVADLVAQRAGREARLEVALAHADLESSRAAVSQAAHAVELASANADQTAELYRQGLRPALEIATAGVQLFEAEVELVRERYGLALAHVDLVAAIGGDPREGLRP